MNQTLAQVLIILETLAKLEPAFVSTWNNLQPFAQALYKQFTGTDMTDEELTVLEAQVDALAARLQEPLPPAQPGDPDYKEPT